MHVTPASSTCPQLVLPQPENLHWWMVSSFPTQATSSIQMSPVPVEIDREIYLYINDREREREQKQLGLSVLKIAPVVKASGGPTAQRSYD